MQKQQETFVQTCLLLCIAGPTPLSVLWLP